MELPYPNQPLPEASQSIIGHINRINKLCDPWQGGFTIVKDLGQKDSQLWPNGATDKDDFANQVVFVEATGSFHVWIVSDDPSNTRYWKELGRQAISGWVNGVGFVEGYGQELRGTQTAFNYLERNSEIRVSIPGGEIGFIVDKVIDNSRVKIFGNAAYETVRGGANNGSWPNYPFIQVVSVVGNTVTWSAPVSDFGLKVGDTYSGYGASLTGVVTSISGNTATLSWIDNSGINNWTQFWFVHRSILPGSTYRTQKPLQVYSDGEQDVVLIGASGTLKATNQISMQADSNGSQAGSYINLNVGSIDMAYKGVASDSDLSRLLVAIRTSDVGPYTKGDLSFVCIAPDKTFYIEQNNGDIAFRTRVASHAASDLVIKQASSTAGGSGKIGMGLLSPAEKLHVSGNILATGTISPGSDARWKENIEVIANALEKISLLRGVTFCWKDKERGDGIQSGLIAQDVEKSGIEGAVKEGDRGYKHVNYNAIISVLVEAVKEIQSRNLSGTHLSYSDPSIKLGMTALPDCWDVVRQIKVFSFCWRSDATSGVDAEGVPISLALPHNIQYGYNAEKIRDFFPELVSENAANVKTVNVFQLHSVLIDTACKKIEEMQQTIDSQSTAIEELRKRLEKLENA